MLLSQSMSIEHRDAILTAATETFGRFGFKKTSIDDIARRAGIGKGTVYLHFESKEELFGAVIRRMAVKALASLQAAVKQAGAPQAKVRAFLEGRLRQHARTAADLRVSEESLLEVLAHAAPYRREARIREAELLEDIISEGNARGVFAVRSPRLAAEGISAGLHGLDAYHAGPDTLGLQGALAELNEIVVRGMLAPARQNRTSE